MKLIIILTTFLTVFLINCGKDDESITNARALDSPTAIQIIGPGDAICWAIMQNGEVKGGNCVPK